jgi:hypothetical protein
MRTDTASCLPKLEAPETLSKSPVGFQNHLLQSIFSAAGLDEPAALPGRNQTHFVAEIRNTFRAWLPREIAPIKLAGFCAEWGASVQLSDPRLVRLRIPQPCAAWRRWLGLQPRLELCLTLSTPPATAKSQTTVTAIITASNCSGQDGDLLLHEAGPRLLRGLRAYLHADTERRQQSRVEFKQLLHAFEAWPSAITGVPVRCVGRDISVGGMKYWSPTLPTDVHVGLKLKSPTGGPNVAVLARVLRTKPNECAGWDVAVGFNPHS